MVKLFLFAVYSLFTLPANSNIHRLGKTLFISRAHQRRFRKLRACMQWGCVPWGIPEGGIPEGGIRGKFIVVAALAGLSVGQHYCLPWPDLCQTASIHYKYLIDYMWFQICITYQLRSIVMLCLYVIDYLVVGICCPLGIVIVTT